jgi:hypothetical protein
LGPLLSLPSPFFIWVNIGDGKEVKSCGSIKQVVRKTIRVPRTRVHKIFPRGCGVIVVATPKKIIAH